MFCKNCGAEIPEGSAFCGNCGMKVPAEPVQEPVNQQYQQPEEPQQPQQPEAPQDTYQSYQQPQYAQQPVYNAQPVQPADIPNPTLWIVLNAILIVIGCCNIPSLLGIIGLVVAIQANNLMKVIQNNDSITVRVGSNAYATQIQNEETRARNMGTVANRLKTAKILFFVGVGLIVLGIVVSVVTGLFASSIEDIQDYIYYNF